jgi:hypothetical protein
MKIILPFAVVITALFFSSCKKDSTSTDNPSTTRVKTYTEDVTSANVSNGHEVDSFNLSYDANGRLVSVISANMPPEKILYTYTSSGVIIYVTGDDNSIDTINNFLKGSLIDSTLEYDNEGGVNEETATQYIYNSSNQLFQTNEYVYTSTAGDSLLEDVINFYYDGNGNLIKDSDYNVTDTYQYYNNLFTTSGLNVIPNFLNGVITGPNSVNLLKSATTTTLYYNYTLTINYTYTFDNENRLIISTGIGTDGSIAIKRYTYY